MGQVRVVMSLEVLRAALQLPSEAHIIAVEPVSALETCALIIEHPAIPEATLGEPLPTGEIAYASSPFLGFRLHGSPAPRSERRPS